jgi:hypothetical protein
VVDARAELAVTLAGRGGQLHTSTVMAALNRGPGSITRAAFSTGGIGPDQVLSAVLSSAFVKLMADPDFARILPQRNVAATGAPVAAAPEFPDRDPPPIPARPARRRRYYTEHQPAEPPPDLNGEADDRDHSDQNWSEVEGAPPPLPRFRIDLGSHRGVAAEAPAPTAAAQEKPAPSLAPSQTPAPGTLYPPPNSVAPEGQGPDLSGP